MSLTPEPALAGAGLPAASQAAQGRGHATTTMVLRDSYLIAGRHLRVLRRSPGRMIYPLVQPLVLLTLFVSVFGNLAISAKAGAGSYREYLIPGIIVQNAVLTSPVTGLAMIRDAVSGLADRFRSLPMPRSSVLIGRLGSDAIVFCTQAVLMLALGSLLGFKVRTGAAGLLGIVAVTVGFGVTMAVTSAWLALVLRDPETAERVLFFPAIALTFCSSAFAPVSRLAGWLQPIARVNPVTAAAELIRSLSSGGAAVVPLLQLGCWMVGLVTVCGFFAVRRWQAVS
jgi:ABC transporter DrrB family efflux protein